MPIVHCLNAQISSSSEHKIEEIIYLKDKKLKVRRSLCWIEDILAVFFPLKLDRAQFAAVQAGRSKHLSWIIFTVENAVCSPKTYPQNGNLSVE